MLLPRRPVATDNAIMGDDGKEDANLLHHAIVLRLHCPPKWATTSFGEVNCGLMSCCESNRMAIGFIYYLMYSTLLSSLGFAAGVSSG